MKPFWIIAVVRPTEGGRPKVFGPAVKSYAEACHLAADWVRAHGRVGSYAVILEAIERTVDEQSNERITMNFNWCMKCGFSSGSVGTGRMPDPQRKWWQFWKTVPCDACGGDGFRKSPGWPDRAEMERLRPDPPPPPPPPPLNKLAAWNHTPNDRRIELIDRDLDCHDVLSQLEMMELIELSRGFFA